jgi:predicted permease
MLNTLLLLVPDFSLIALGTLLMRWGKFEKGFWHGVERLVYFILFPALLFNSVAGARLDFSATAAMVMTGLAAIAVGALGGIGGYWCTDDSRTSSSAHQCAFRFNSYIALALAARLAGEHGIALMAILVGVGVPLCNALAVLALARHSSHGVAKELMRNPLLMATTAGLLFNLAGLTLPGVVAATLSRAGAASIAMGLIAVGAGLKLSGMAGTRVLLAWITTVKLVLVPLGAWLTARAFGLVGLQLQIVVLFAALPTASSAYILAQRMGGNGPAVALLISFGTLVSAATIPLWLALVS